MEGKVPKHKDNRKHSPPDILLGRFLILIPYIPLRHYPRFKILSLFLIPPQNLIDFHLIQHQTQLLIQQQPLTQRQHNYRQIHQTQLQHHNQHLILLQQYHRQQHLSPHQYRQELHHQVLHLIHHLTLQVHQTRHLTQLRIRHLYQLQPLTQLIH